jgi:2,3-bisphosphoglycerate-independent phosphoglycerate mutase
VAKGTEHAKPRPGLLIILDGFAWGDAADPCNAVARAATPTLDALRRDWPSTELANHGPAVGLPEGQMGNSEVGHLNIGAGRVVLQDFMRVNRDIQSGAFARNEAYRAAFVHVGRTGGRLHLIGLLGPGGVHAHESHFGAALRSAAAAGLTADRVWVHAIGDGRDTPPRSALGFLDTLSEQIEQAGVGRVADFVGRYYAMDRDKRWERIEHAFRLYAAGEAEREAEDAHAAVEAAYDAGEDDEFVKATLIDARGTIRDGDAVVWLNYRPDRSRQMTRAWMQPDFAGFDRAEADGRGGRAGGERDIAWVCTTLYDKAFADFPGVHVAYPPVHVEMTLAEHVSVLGLTQFHAAETEKYAHVTYFLNGGRETPFTGEDRKLVASPKVATYDLKPEMSAEPLTDEVLSALGSGGHDLVVVNYANPDMLGHTGDLAATIRAMEFMDNCVGRLVTVAQELGFVTLITSDHGNAEEMCTRNADGSPGEPVTKHSMNPSPLLVVGAEVSLREDGALSNVAPTLLELMGLPVPPHMTAGSLLRRKR